MKEQQSKNLAKLGIVLATYEEAGNLPPLIDSLEELCLPLELHIFVVDDNSPDGTSRVTSYLASRYGNICLITRPRKLGLGSALRRGMEAALAEDCVYILTMDADLSHSPQDVPRLLAAAETGDADVVQASRYAEGGRTVDWGRWRRFKSHVANRLCRWLLGSPSEATSNFRVYSRRCAQIMVKESRSRDYEFQPECMLIAMRYGLPIVEVPITFSGRAAGKSKLGLAQDVRWILFFLAAVIGFRLHIGRFSRAPLPGR